MKIIQLNFGPADGEIISIPRFDRTIIVKSISGRIHLYQKTKRYALNGARIYQLVQWGLSNARVG